MTSKLKLSASAVALALLIAGGVTSARAADVVDDPGCTLSGAVGIGYMHTWSDVSLDTNEDLGDKDEFDVDWNTPFGEAGGLVTCGAWNAQADFAYYDHTADDLNGLGSDKLAIVALTIVKTDRRHRRIARLCPVQTRHGIKPA